MPEPLRKAAYRSGPTDAMPASDAVVSHATKHDHRRRRHVTAYRTELKKRRACCHCTAQAITLGIGTPNTAIGITKSSPMGINTTSATFSGDRHSSARAEHPSRARYAECYRALGDMDEGSSAR
jgi:hypothetical protein